MAESWESRMIRWRFNLCPAYRGTGARVTYISSDFREARVKLPLNWRTRNYVGTIFGGSLYGAVDPMYMILLIKILGPDYVVWDKAATIRFVKPGRGTLFARFLVEESGIEEIKKALETAPSIDRVYSVDLTDAQGVVHATTEKTVYIRRSVRSAGSVS
jgi:acyl-coenzyme A thioesterase PaaI-like protein